MNPDATGASTNYNANGLVCNKTPTLVVYACGQGPSVAGVTQYTYNDANELTTMSDNVANPATPTVWSQNTTYTYATGLLTSTTDANAKTINYAYNAAGQVTCVGYPVSATTSCATGATPSATNTTLTKSYDALGRLATTTDWLGDTVNYTYANKSLPGSATTITDKTASTTVDTVNYAYDNVGNVTGLISTSPGAATLTDAWTYNADEQVATSSINGATQSTPTAYNANAQITQATNPTTTSGNDTYALALNGEVTSDTTPGTSPVTTTSTYNAGDELCNSGPSATACGSTPSTGTAYSFNANGERTSSSPYAGGVAAPSTNDNWNAYGELCSTNQSSSTSPAPSATACATTPTSGTSYSYNGSGLRTTTSTSSSSTATSWDTQSGSIPLDLNDATTTSSGTTTTSYLYGDLLFGGTAPTEQITTSSSGTTVSFLVSNQTGVQVVYSANAGSLGNVQELAVYSLYGQRTLTSGTVVTPFGFQGSYTDSTGLIYLINRWYDPATDQFMSIDPMVQQTNQPYVFTNDSPLNATDPMGLKGSPGDQCMGRSDAGSCDKAVLKSVEKAAATPLTWKTGVAVIVNVGGIFGPDETGLGEGADLAFDSWATSAAASSESEAATSTLERVGSGLKDDPYHRVTSFVVDDPAAESSQLIGADGITRTQYTLPGEVNGRAGLFDWIVEDREGGRVVTHQFFRRGI